MKYNNKSWEEIDEDMENLDPSKYALSNYTSSTPVFIPSVKRRRGNGYTRRKAMNANVRRNGK